MVQCPVNFFCSKSDTPYQIQEALFLCFSPGTIALILLNIFCCWSSLLQTVCQLVWLWCCCTQFIPIIYCSCQQLHLTVYHTSLYIPFWWDAEALGRPAAQPVLAPPVPVPPALALVILATLLPTPASLGAGGLGSPSAHPSHTYLGRCAIGGSAASRPAVDYPVAGRPAAGFLTAGSAAWSCATGSLLRVGWGPDAPAIDDMRYGAARERQEVEGGLMGGILLRGVDRAAFDDCSAFWQASLPEQGPPLFLMGRQIGSSGVVVRQRHRPTSAGQWRRACLKASGRSGAAWRRWGRQEGTALIWLV